MRQDVVRRLMSPISIVIGILCRYGNASFAQGLDGQRRIPVTHVGGFYPFTLGVDLVCFHDLEIGYVFFVAIPIGNGGHNAIDVIRVEIQSTLE